VGIGLHHRDVVRAALEDFEQRMQSGSRDEAFEQIRRRVRGDGLHEAETTGGQRGGTAAGGTGDR
jgi:hypothetical protein